MIAYLLLYVLFFSYEVSSQELVETNKIVILPIGTNLILKNVTPSKLTKQDIKIIDSLLVIGTRNEKLDLKEYKRQYIVYVDEKGNKNVYINCFCSSDEFKDYWKKELVRVDDGGRCFFNVTINITKLYIEHIDINGYG